MNKDAIFERVARAAGFQPDGEIRIGGHYVPLVRDGNTCYVSGQVPRVGDRVAVTGRAGGAVGLAEAQRAATLCALRALALLQRHPAAFDLVAMDFASLARQLGRRGVGLELSEDYCRMAVKRLESETLPLQLHLGHPERSFEMYLTPHRTSAMAMLPG